MRWGQRLSRRQFLIGAAGAGTVAATSAFAPTGLTPPNPHRGLPRGVPEGPIILRAANVVTMNPQRPAAKAVAVVGGRIVAVGSLAHCRRQLPKASVVDLGDSTLMPGFVEPHSHPIGSGMSTEAPAYNVAPWVVPTWEGVQRVARRAAAEVPAGNSIVLFGLDRLLHQCEFPDASVMDALFGDRVATIIALSQHQAAVTTSALRAFGWLETPPKDPVAGTFGRRPDGSLDGIANELPAVIQMVNPVLASLGGNPLEQSAAYFARLSRAGITSMGELGYLDTYRSTYEALCGLPSLPIRVRVYHATNDPGYLKPLTTSVREDRLSKGGIKFWADGSPWLGSIATSFPYLDTEVVRRAGIEDLFPRERALNYNRDQLDAMLARSAGSGWQVACHANGDLTIDLVLDAYEHALTQQGLIGTDHRWRLEHVGAVRPDQLKRMSRLGVVPTFALFQMMQWGDLLDGQMYESRYGARWSPVGDAAATDLDQLHQSYHNDGNISPPSPLANVQAAVSRRANRLTRKGAYRLASGRMHGPEQQVSVTTALRAITINAAYILHRDHLVGSIEVGKLADFTQLSANPYAVNPSRIVDEVEVLGTWLAGQPNDPQAFVSDAAAITSAATSLSAHAVVAGCCARHHPPTTAAT